jgi:hypothetical protein
MTRGGLLFAPAALLAVVNARLLRFVIATLVLVICRCTNHGSNHDCVIPAMRTRVC